MTLAPPRPLAGLLALLLGGAIAAPWALGPAARANGSRAPQYLPIEARWCLEDERCIALEMADDDPEQTLGLQLRPPLPPLQGMWFPQALPTPVRFWMHRTPAPLDMLFVREGRVIAIEADAQPCPRLPCRSYGPEEPVDGVLELAAGQAAVLGIRPGRAVEIERLPLSQPNPAAPAAPARD